MTVAADATGHGHDGLYQGHTATSVAGAGALTGELNTSMVCDGVDDCVVVPDDGALEMAGAMTWEAWVYPTSVTHTNGNSRPRILCKNLTLLWVRSSDRKIQFEGGIGYSTPQNVTCSVALALHTWTHVVVTWDDATVTFYQNGASVDAYAMTGIPPGTTDPLIIGEHRLDPAMKRFWQGRLDEVAVYDTVLTAGRVAAHYAAASAGTYAATVLADTPVGYWRLADEPYDLRAMLQTTLGVTNGQEAQILREYGVQGAYQHWLVHGHGEVPGRCRLLRSTAALHPDVQAAELLTGLLA